MATNSDRQAVGTRSPRVQVANTRVACAPGRILKPAAVICCRKYAVLPSSLSRSCVLFESKSNTTRDAPATAGASVLLKR